MLHIVYDTQHCRLVHALGVRAAVGAQPSPRRAGNRHFAGLIAQLRTSLSRYELACMQQVRSREKADQQHREILSALETGDARRAASLLTEHWHDGEEVILRWLAGSDPTSAGTSGNQPRQP